MSEYLCRLIYQVQNNEAHRKFIQMLRVEYDLPKCLPPYPPHITALEALEILNKQYPSDVAILQALVEELKKG